MDNKLRTVGIPSIDETPWGTHFCQFYETKGGLLDLLVPYFKTGLENHEFCLWVTSAYMHETDAREAMTKAVPEFDRYVQDGQIEIIPHTQWYLKDGDFDLQRVLQGWIEKHNQALARGYDGIRVTGDATSTIASLGKSGWNDFVEYEQAVDKAIGQYKMLALCTYALDKCGPTSVIDVVQHHQFALVERTGRWERIESAELKRTKAELRKLKDQLEALIDQRTIQLNATVEELRTEAARHNETAEALYESEERFRTFMDNASAVAAWMKDDNYRYVYANKPLERALGIPFEAMKGRTDFDFRSRETAEELRANDLRVMSSGQILETIETVPAPDGRLRVWFIYKFPFRNAHGQRFVAGVGIDITDRKRLEQELERLAKDRLLLLESTMEGIYGIDLHGHCTFVNKAAAAMFGYTPEDLTGKDAHEVFHHSHLDGSPYPSEMCAIYRAFRVGKGCRMDSEVFWRKDGTSFPVEYTSHPIFENGTTTGAVVTFSDITDRKHAEEIRTQFLERVISAQEEERKRIAQELHDETGQSLTALLVGLRQLDDSPSLEEARTRTQELRKLTAKTIEEVNRLAVGLRPRVLDDLGLEAALRQYAEDFSRIHGVTADVLSIGLTTRRLPDAVEMALFRIVQEALTNIAKHARAKSVSILLRSTPSEVRLIVEDDGCGFSANERLKADPVRKHLGIHGMRKRAMLLKGSFSVESSPGRGTTISAQIPLTGAQDEASSRHSR